MLDIAHQNYKFINTIKSKTLIIKQIIKLVILRITFLIKPTTLALVYFKINLNIRGIVEKE